MALTRRRLLGATAIGSIGLAGCSGDGDGAGESTPTAGDADGTPTDGSDGASTTEVAMVNTAFDPVRATVEPGTTVEWVNQDSFGHDVTSATFTDGATEWDFATSVSAGGTATFTFEQAGVYQYYCTIHGEGSMCGAVVVGDASMDGSLPCESGGGNGGGDGGGVY